TLLLVFSFIFFFIITPPPPTSTLFPYTTLFRSPPIGLSQRRFMMLAVIPFPNIDPVLFSIGPFAVRWYALAYIVGILGGWFYARSEEHTSELQSQSNLVCRLLLEKKKIKKQIKH